MNGLPWVLRISTTGPEPWIPSPAPRGREFSRAVPCTLDPCNCGRPASAWIVTKSTTRSDARTVLQRHSRSSLDGCPCRSGRIDQIDRIDRRRTPTRWNHRARRHSARIVRCSARPRTAAESGGPSAAAPSVWHSSESLVGSGGTTTGQATRPARLLVTTPPVKSIREITT